jgi:hypothetical protein
MSGNKQNPPQRGASPATSLDAEANHIDARLLPPTGDIDRDDDNRIEMISDLSTVGAKQEMLAFMEEKLQISIMESNDQLNPEPAVFVAVNGEGGGPMKSPWLPRNHVITVSRKIVERLARARTIRISTRETRDHRGELTTVVEKRSALKYPFQVVHDPNPRGIPWLTKLLNQV